jgi:peptidoglycan/xylan/chitin deacetylase (PgdA/CDA1 family)
MKIIQCWDDGIVSDIPLIKILKKYNAKATFNLNAGINREERHVIWNNNGQDVIALATHELNEVYQGFDIANHSLNHPVLTNMSIEEAKHEILENKHQLEAIFRREIKGFCYPFGATNDDISTLVELSGHSYARAVGRDDDLRYFGRNRFKLNPTCHFLDQDFWQRYEEAREVGVFYFWGHSYEMTTPAMWNEFEEKIKTISLDKTTTWSSLESIF